MAGGDAGLAHRLEEAGIGTYLHAPSVAHVKDLLNKGVRSIILEGHEAGGHVGALGSLVLWELGAREVAALAPEEAASTRVLLAGGIGGVRGALAAAVLASRIEETGAGVGIQIGTAYLMTDDAATSGAVPPRLQAALLRGENTIVSGRSVNLPARWLECPGVRGMVEQELAWESEGLPLPQRKALAERAVLEHLRGALVGRGEADEAGAEVAAPEGVDQPEQAEFMCGQVIATRSHPFTISALHEELTAGAQELAGRAASLGAGADEVAQDAVAIIGIGCIFPKANDASEYWTNILRGVSAIKEVPEDRWDPKVYYDPSRENLEKSSSKLGAFVEGFRKDPVKFRIPPVSEPSIERIQFATLEVARQALDDAGYLEKGFPRERTGVILGTSTGSDLARLYALRSGSAVFFDALKSVDEFTQLPGDLSEMIARKTGETLRESLPEFTEDSCPGVLGSIVAGRVSNYFNLGGSSFTVDGACASSLTAVSLAVAGLRNGQYDLVLAGGSDFGLDPATYTLFSSLQALSDTGSFPFDERADGFVMGEGAGLILLKRLPDAIRDGDKIYAVVRGIGSSSDGSARSVTAPDPKGQVRAILGAYEGLPFGPGSVSLVEAHGTATVAGDHAEITSLSEVFREYVEERKSVALGSVKSMIGHLKTAAGVAGLIKTALALHHRVLPPTINCEQPRSGVDWDNLPLYLNTEPCPWDAGDGPRRAAVNAFGFGGVNYHVVLEEAPGEHLVPAGRVEPGEEAVEAPAEVLTFRAPSRAQLLEEVGAVLDGLGRGEPASLRAVSSQLRQHASTHGPTLAVVAAGADELRGRLEKAWQLLNDGSRTEYTSAQGIYYGESRLGADEKIAFLFPGQGAQYVNMAGDLANCFPAARETLRKVDSIVHQWSDHSVLPAIQCEEGLGEEELQRLAEQLIRADYNHPALLTMGIVISDILRRAGVRPHLLAGHSVGEYSALEAAGVFDLEAAVAVICARGSRFYEHSLPSGAMASVAAPSEQTEQVLSEVADFVRVANRNCPAQTVISGDVKGIENVVRRFEQLGIQCKRLAVSSGFHTPLFSSFVAPFRQFLDKVAFRAPALPVQCNLTGEAYPSGGDFADAMRDALARHMISPVEFISNVESMYRNGARLFIEIGPGSTLCSFVDSILGDRPHWTFPTNLPRRSASVQLLHALAFCAAKGLDVDPEKVLPRPRTKDRLVASRQAPARPAAETKHQAVGPPALLREALSGQDDRLVRDYVSQRGDFLRDMVRLDFQHFAGEQARPGGGQARGDGLERQVIELVSRRTGYPPEIIDLDLDVEAELGLDSIKQVEIVRELESTLGVDLVAGAERAHRRITTLRDVVETFREQLPERVPAAGPETGSQHAPHGPEGDWNVDSHRWVSEALEAPLTGGGASEALAGRK
ncbi:MAG: beta-ketoacyl synthase N-terminal-like domain-containing protein, partial [Candidatus Brocadiia bacterium]|nr:beta-ketoacyl synthase N-terminal-like domain-containing protein [Candidatus Brocadiia bacterium]